VGGLLKGGDEAPGRVLWWLGPAFTAAATASGHGTCSIGTCTRMLKSVQFLREETSDCYEFAVPSSRVRVSLRQNIASCAARYQQAIAYSHGRSKAEQLPVSRRVEPAKNKECSELEERAASLNGYIC
jgi:hypothetical protein